MISIILIIIFGLCIGSFLNVCVYRIQKEESIAFPPSHCTTCNNRLTSTDLVPVLSYIFLKGKCRYCNEKISIIYPIIEILNSIIYLTIYVKYGFTLEFFKFCIFSSLLIVIATIDFKTKYVYSSTVLFGIISGLIFLGLKFITTKVIPLNYLVGAFIGFAFIYLIVKLTGGMGEGDIDIAIICGLFLGTKGIIVTLFLAVILGGIVSSIIMIFKLKDRKAEIAFGPYLAFAGVISSLYASNLIYMYLKIFM